MSISFDSFYKKFSLTLKGDLSYPVELGMDTFGNMTRINNALRADIPERLKSSKSQLENLYQQVEDAKRELKNPFAQERLLVEKETRLAFLNAQLNIDSRPERVMEAAETDLPQEAYAKSAKPSILAGLHKYGDGRKTDSPDKQKNNDITM